VGMTPPRAGCCSASELVGRFSKMGAALASSFSLPPLLCTHLTLAVTLKDGGVVHHTTHASIVAAAIMPTDPALDWLSVSTRSGCSCGISTGCAFRDWQGALQKVGVKRRRGDGGNLHHLLVCTGLRRGWIPQTTCTCDWRERLRGS